MLSHPQTAIATIAEATAWSIYCTVANSLSNVAEVQQLNRDACFLLVLLTQLVILIVGRSVRLYLSDILTEKNDQFCLTL